MGISREEYFTGGGDEKREEEKRLIRNSEKLKELHLRLEHLVGERFNPLDFIGMRKRDGSLITEDEVLSDLKILEEKMSHWNSSRERDGETEQFADLTEMGWMILFQIFSQKKMEVKRTSLFDDVRGIDFILTTLHTKDKSHFGFGVDASFSSTSVAKKLRNTELKIKGKRFSSSIDEEKWKKNTSYPLYLIKYFIDENGKYTSLLVPRVIIGMDYRSSEKLILGVGEGDSHQIVDSLAYPRAVLEVLLQSRYYYLLAKKENKKGAMKAYAKLYNEFFQVFRKRKELFKERREILRDNIVRQFLKYFHVHEKDAFKFGSLRVLDKGMGYQREEKERGRQEKKVRRTRRKGKRRRR